MSNVCDTELHRALVNYRIKCDHYYSDMQEGVINHDEYRDAIHDEANRIIGLFDQELAKREALNRADIAQAIGYCKGLGHPNTYLEKRYPDIAAFNNQTKESR